MLAAPLLLRGTTRRAVGVSVGCVVEVAILLYSDLHKGRRNISGIVIVSSALSPRELLRSTWLVPAEPVADPSSVGGAQRGQDPLGKSGLLEEVAERRHMHSTLPGPPRQRLLRGWQNVRYAVSHAWLTPRHPDPDRVQLKACVCELSKCNSWKFLQWVTAAHDVVFFDYASVPQNGPSGEKLEPR